MLYLIFLIIFLSHFLKKRLISIERPLITYFEIPKIIYRTHKSMDVSINMYYHCHKKWIDLNPTFNMLWFTGEECEKFVKHNKRLYKAYKSILPGAFKADIWRAYILYKYGGIYIDSYTEPYIPISRMIGGCMNHSKHQFISILDKYGIHNGMIICTPKHPFLKKYLSNMITNIENKFYGNRDLEITGPGCLLKSINTVLGTNKTFLPGWNYYGELSFYLYKFESGPSQYVYDKNKLLMRKKYSLIELIIQKIINYNSTYFSMWRNKKIYL
jgi:mannosyltransferase OCH1-like enzyme